MFRTIADHAPVGIGFAGPDGNLIYANDRWRTLASFHGRLPAGTEVMLSLVHPEDRDAVVSAYAKSRLGADEVRASIRVNTDDDRHVNLAFRKVRGDGGHVLGYAVGLSDVTELTAAVEEVRRSEERFRSVADSLPVGVFRVSRRERLIWGNERLEEITGSTSDESWGSSIFAYTHPDDRDAVQSASRDAVQSGERYESRHRIVTATGEVKWVLTRSKPILDATGRIIEFVGSLEDITDLHQESARLAHKATHDALTGLPNRASLVDLIASLVRDQPGRADIGIIFIDLDRFKDINDTWGHQAGDAVLVEVARRLTSVIRADDTVGRYGGDEFVVVCPRISVPSALDEVATRIGEAIAASPIEHDERHHQVTASIGFALGPGSGSADELLHQADAAMYQVKRRR